MTYRRVLAAALCLLAAACGAAAPPVPADRYYRVLLPAPESRGGSAVLPGVLSVPPLETRGLLRERPLVYVDAARPLEMRQYEYHFWSEPLSVLLQDQLVSYLRAAGMASSVLRSSASVPADFELAGRVIRVEQGLGGPAPRVLVELELGLVRTADNLLVGSRTYRVEQPARDGSVMASVEAMNGALADIFDSFVVDTRRTLLAIDGAAG